MRKSEIQRSIDNEDRIKLYGNKKEAYRAFRDILQHEIFDKKNYDISIVELSRQLGLH